MKNDYFYRNVKKVGYHSTAKNLFVKRGSSLNQTLQLYSLTMRKNYGLKRKKYSQEKRFIRYAKTIEKNGCVKFFSPSSNSDPPTALNLKI